MIDPLILASLEDMRIEADAALAVVTGRTNLEVAEDPVLSRALAHSLMLIGEISSQMPDVFRKTHPHLGWNDARALRNRIVHGYRTVVPNILIDTARDDLPLLIEQIDALLKDAPL